MKTLPASLLVEDKPCLVVGAGKIGLRKTGHLLDAGARVTVIAPNADKGIRALADAGRITYHARAFDSADVTGMTAVMTTTDEPDVNHAVIDACNAAAVPCNAIDENWTDGNFITPAIFRLGDITLAISTGGRSCREAMHIKNVLGRILEEMESAGIEAGACDSEDELYDKIIHQLQSRNPTE